MNVEIWTEAAQFPEMKYVNGIFVAVCTKISRVSYLLILRQIFSLTRKFTLWPKQAMCRDSCTFQTQGMQFLKRLGHEINIIVEDL
jgi:hypothetical protein